VWFLQYNIDTKRTSSKFLEKALEGAMIYSENLNIFRYVLGSDVIGFMLLHLLLY